MLGSIFNTLIIQPIFNLLVAVYALIPGHNFGLAIIIFTIIVRLLMWPIVKKQLHQAKAMRQLQPEIKRIKASTKGNKQQESLMLMELYKERGISPFGSFGTLVIQLIILIGLYQGLVKVVANPEAIIDNAYPFLQNLNWMKELAADISKFDTSLFGFMDLTKAAIPAGGSNIYWPGMALVIGSVVVQYFQSKQLLPEQKDSRSLRRILREASDGKQADQSEVQAAIGRFMRYLLPGMIFIFTVGLASALSLYWLVGGVVAYIQQRRVLNQDEEEMEVLADKPLRKKATATTSKSGDGTRVIINGEVVKDTTSKASTATPPKTKKTKTVKSKATKRRK
jgi:YidC/Oxa1 family membrane protein insertase